MADYKSYTEDGKCIFCEIAKGNLQTPGIFWEDEEFMAFLSTYPNTEGFSVVIPKEHYGSDVLAMPDQKLQKFIIAAKKISKILITYFDDVGRVGLIMEGTSINHAHIKLSPMHGTAHLKKRKWKQQHSIYDKYFETYDGYLCSNDGPKADDNEISKLADGLKKISSSIAGE
jgi:histidine triad (HIT) family protein